MSQTQLINCISCGIPLATVNITTGGVRLITTKTVEGQELTDVQKDAAFNINDGMAIVCGCGTENGVF